MIKMIEVKEENHFTDEHLMCTFDFLEIQLEASVYFFFFHFPYCIKDSPSHYCFILDSSVHSIAEASSDVHDAVLHHQPFFFFSSPSSERASR